VTGLGVIRAPADAGARDRFHHSPVAEFTSAKATERYSALTDAATDDDVV
jgi:hypothetical protein